MSEKSYKRAEKIIIILMILGMLTMFQPWFRSVASLFDPLSAEGDFGRTYSREIAPMVFRYGFYIVLLSTVAFIVLSHYNVDELQRAVAEKGKALTWLLIALPVFVGFVLLINLSIGLNLAALLGVLAFVFAIAIWHWRRWGVVGYVLTSIGWMVMAVMGTAEMNTAVINFILTIVMLVLIWPRREKFH